MLTAKIVDEIWATVSAPGLSGYKLMLAEVIGGGANAGQRIVAADQSLSAGMGDRVLIATGSTARRMAGDDSVPVDAAIVGIIDEDCEF